LGKVMTGGKWVMSDVGSGTIPDRPRRIAVGPTSMAPRAGVGSICCLLIVPETELLTLQMEQARSQKALSWWWNATNRMARQKQDSERKRIFLITLFCLVSKCLVFPIMILFLTSVPLVCQLLRSPFQISSCLRCAYSTVLLSPSPHNGRVMIP
jgi:hypothetical protein